jgi:hypothetical protein
MAAHGIRLRTGLQTLNCSVASYAAVAIPPMVKQKLSQQHLNQITNGQREFESEQEAQEFLRVLDTMQYLQETVTPRVPIAWSDVLNVRDVLVETFKTRLDEEDPIVPRCWYIRLSVMNFLKSVNSNGPVTTINYGIDAAAFTDQALAEECVRRLHALNVNARTELLTAPRRKSTITVSLEEIGFAPELTMAQEP